MRIKALLAVVLAVGLAGCGNDPAPPAADTWEPAPAAAPADDADATADEAAQATPAAPRLPRTPPVGPPIDADALALMAAIDAHAAAVAKLAEAHTQTLPIKDLAKVLQVEYAADLAEVRKLEPTVGPIQHHDRLQALKDKQAAELTVLTDTPEGQSFDVAFLEAVIAGHTEALALLDDELIPTVRKDPVRDYLTKARATYAAQQEKAQAILAAY